MMRDLELVSSEPHEKVLQGHKERERGCVCELGETSVKRGQKKEKKKRKHKWAFWGFILPGIETETTVLDVSTTGADSTDALGANAGLSRRTSELVLVLVAPGLDLASCAATLVPLVSADSHVDWICGEERRRE